MKTIQLSQGKQTVVDDSLWEAVNAYKWFYSHGYARRNRGKHPNRTSQSMHRFVYEAVHGPVPKCMEIDHIDGCRTNNQLENLRIVTCRRNTHNRHYHRQRTTTSEYIGVSRSKRTREWRSVIRINGKQRHLGYFSSEEDAHNAYQAALAKLENQP